MPNMSYCRFHNTVLDLQECKEHLDDENLSPSEKKARDDLIRLCKEIAEDYGDDC